MDPPQSQAPSGAPATPVSVFHNPVDQLLHSGAMTGASRPGLLGATGRFEILEVIGSGSMGIVVLARDPQRMEKVAIKFLRPEFTSNASLAARFRAEACHMEHLKHPGIVPVLEVFDTANALCFVMPFMERGSVAKLLQAGKPLSPQTVLPIAMSVAEALAHAHAKGVLHRDLKPANLLLNGDGRAALCDFGLARAFVGDPFLDVDVGHCEGTAPYMSPAVANGEAEDTRCDIYAFGAVLYEMLTGEPPYQGATTQEVLARIRGGPPPPIRQVNPKADAHLAIITEGAMARELRQRYAQMRDVLKDLQRVEAGLAPLGPRGHRGAMVLRDSLARIPGSVAWALAAAFAVMVGLASIWWFGSRHLEVISTVTLPQILEWGNAQTAQWDGAKGLELLLPRSRDPQQNEIIVAGRQGQIIWPISQPPAATTALRLSFVADINGDGAEEVFRSWADQATAHLDAVNQSGATLRKWSVRRTQYMRERWGQDTTALWGKHLDDIDGDGRKELVVSVVSDHSQPRGLYCFDLETNDPPEWAYTMAAYPSSVLVTDLDGDGLKEIVMGSAAPANGIEHTDGTDDEHSYLMALSAQGKLLWQKMLGDYYTIVHPIAVLAEGRPPRLFAWTTATWDVRAERGQHHHPDHGTIMAFSANGRIQRRFYAGRSLLSCAALPASEHHDLRIVAADRLGRMCELTGDLEFVRETALVPKPVGAVFTEVIGTPASGKGSSPYLIFKSVEYQKFGPSVAGGTPEEHDICQWLNRSVIVLDANLNEVARFTEPGPFSTGSWNVLVRDLDADGQQEILWLDERLRVLQLRSGS